MPEHTQQLRERLAEIQDLNSATALLDWDQQTMMPPRGAEQRAEALGTLARISHDLLVATETGRLLDAASTEVNGDDGSDDARLIRRVRRRFDKATKVPTELATELARAASIGQEAWAAARREDDFGAFAPYLERNLELARRYADCFDGFEVPYDALLDDYQPRMTSAEVGALFDRLKAELVPLIAATSAHTGRLIYAAAHPRPDRGTAAPRRRDRGNDGFRSRGLAARRHSPPLRDELRCAATCGSQPDGTRGTFR